MSTRSGIFIAHCFPEKKWADRVVTALKPVLASESVTAWDERRLHAGAFWKAELAEIIASRKVALLLVSDLFLESDFVRRAKLPTLLASARADGLKICWVLTGHCLHDLAGLNPADAAHDLHAALDGLGLEKRDIELTKIANHVAQQLGSAPPEQALLPEPVPPALHTLDTAMLTRHATILQLRRLAYWLLFVALAGALLALPAALLGLTHFLLLAGFAGFVASQALLVQARVEYLGQGLLCLRYTRSGLADESLPARQRDPLVRRAEEIAG